MNSTWNAAFTWVQSKVTSSWVGGVCPKLIGRCPKECLWCHLMERQMYSVCLHVHTCAGQGCVGVCSMVKSDSSPSCSANRILTVSRTLLYLSLMKRTEPLLSRAVRGLPDQPCAHMCNTCCTMCACPLEKILSRYKNVKLTTHSCLINKDSVAKIYGCIYWAPMFSTWRCRTGQFVFYKYAFRAWAKILRECKVRIETSQRASSCVRRHMQAALNQSCIKIILGWGNAASRSALGRSLQCQWWGAVGLSANWLECGPYVAGIPGM